MDTCTIAGICSIKMDVEYYWCHKIRFKLVWVISILGTIVYVTAIDIKLTFCIYKVTFRNYIIITYFTSGFLKRNLWNKKLRNSIDDNIPYAANCASQAYGWVV